MSRQILEEVLEQYGAKIMTSVTSKTDLVIALDNHSPAKIAKAIELGIPVVYLKANPCRLTGVSFVAGA